MKTLNRTGIQRMAGGGSGSTVVGGSGSGGSGSGTADYAAEAGHAQTADEATHATSADTASNLDANSTDWNKILRKDVADTAAEIITFAKGLVSTLVAKFKAGIKIGSSDQYGINASGDATLNNISGVNISGSSDATIGGDMDIDGNTTVDSDLNVGGDVTITGKTQGTTADFSDVTMDNLGKTTDKVLNIHAVNMNTENLTVTKEAHFFKLVVDEFMANKGALIISNASCVAEVVAEDQTSYMVYFSTTDKDGNTVSNPWMQGDLAICLTFKCEGAGTFNNVYNRYYWRKVLYVYSNQTYQGKTYHVICMSKVPGEYDGSTIPEVGDNIMQLGYAGSVSDNEYRKSAVILSSYPTMDTGVTPPSLAFYKGITDFNLESHRYTFIDGLSNEFMGNFKILVNGSYTNLTTVLATINGLISNVQKTVKGKNLIPSEGWSNMYGKLLGVDNFNPDLQKLDSGGDDIIYSPIIFLPAGSYVFSCYSDDADLMLYVYYSVNNRPYAESMDQDFYRVTNVASGDTYQSKPRRYVSFNLESDYYVILNLYDDNNSFVAYRPQLEAGTTPTTWEYGTIIKSSQIKQTADDIELRAGEAGLNISGTTREINLIAGKVNFMTAGGQTNPKISIDPTTGTLNAVDGIFDGTVVAKVLKQMVCEAYPSRNEQNINLLTIDPNGGETIYAEYYHTEFASDDASYAAVYVREHGINVGDIFYVDSTIVSAFTESNFYVNTGFATYVVITDQYYDGVKKYFPVDGTKGIIRIPKPSDCIGMVITFINACDGRNINGNWAQGSAHIICVGHESDNLFYQSINRYPSTQQGVQSNEAVINGATWTMYVRTPGGSIPNHSISNNHCVDADNVYTRLENNVVRLYSNGTYWIVLDGRAV